MSLRIAGIDYGTVRIGIATADSDVGIAGPYETYSRRNERLDAEYFRRLATDERIGRFVVGLPVHLSGGESQKSAEARAFGAWLQETTGIPVEFFDERFDFLRRNTADQTGRVARRYSALFQSDE